MHFGIICPPVSGHLHPFSALGRELIARGHRVTCFQIADLEKKICSEELEFSPVGFKEFPAGSLTGWLEELGTLKGWAALRFTIGAVRRTSEAVLRDAPGAVSAAKVDALLVDQMEPAGGAVAEHLGLPFITVCNALIINRDAAVPPPFIGWRYQNTVWARGRNRLGYAASDWVTQPIARMVAAYRAKWHLPALTSPDDSFSKRLQISQMSRELDFPRSTLPSTFHYVGPLRRAKRVEIPFPWERLDGRPVLYASLGTLQNSREPVFRCFAEACRGYPVQLVITHGGGLTATEVRNLPGDPLVVEYAPQVEVLARASLTVTHAGLNTVLDSLAAGVPLVTVPITYEQPAIARRVEWAGVGRSIPFKALNPVRLRMAIESVLRDPRFASNARRVSLGIQAAGGVPVAADLIEAALR
jgi:MGT family glycosyltransferase